jgi:hypothetical protein
LSENTTQGQATISEFILGRNSATDSKNTSIQNFEPGLELGSPDLDKSKALLHYFIPFRHSGSSYQDIFNDRYSHSQEVGIGLQGEGENGYNDTYQRVLDWMKCNGEIQTDANGVVSCKPVINNVTVKLNDTGITSCSNETVNDLTCPQTNYPKQDAQQGRDVTHNDDSDGHAGFSFTKLDSNGLTLSANATTWSCVKDNVTGLIWEVKTDDGGLRDKKHKYTWYNSTGINDGGSAGEENGGSCSDSTNCDTEKYIQQVNSQGFCGATDWRMPTIKELENINVLDGSFDYSIDSNYFPNGLYGTWSSTPVAYPSSDNANYAWHTDLSGTTSYAGSALYGWGIRLVRSGQ